MILKFRFEILKGEHTFYWRGLEYQVLDDFIIYQPDTDTIYYKDTDF